MACWSGRRRFLATCPGWAPALTVMMGQAKFIPRLQPPVMMFLTSSWQRRGRIMCGLKHLLQLVKTPRCGGDCSSAAEPGSHRHGEAISIANGEPNSLARPRWAPPCPFLPKILEMSINQLWSTSQVVSKQSAGKQGCLGAHSPSPNQGTVSRGTTRGFCVCLAAPVVQKRGQVIILDLNLEIGCCRRSFLLFSFLQLKKHSELKKKKKIT